MKATLPILGILAFALAGCDKPSSSCDTSDTSTTCTGDSTNDTTQDLPSPTYAWDNDGLTVTIDRNPGSGFDLGMAETGSTGTPWYGEDCFNGDAGYHYCHSFSADTGSLTALQDPNRDPDNVVEGSTTLLNADLAYINGNEDRITYMVTFDNGSSPPCITWGNDVSYYSTFNCTVYGQ
jgi:hypothetical protein